MNPNQANAIADRDATKGELKRLGHIEAKFNPNQSGGSEAEQGDWPFGFG